MASQSGMGCKFQVFLSKMGARMIGAIAHAAPFCELCKVGADKVGTRPVALNTGTASRRIGKFGCMGS